ncbi:MAG: hypothetical protein QG614_21 [Patescibacteria group bacterium]|nr:hypothetical protein [Patescibacteria group bacterium]
MTLENRMNMGGAIEDNLHKTGGKANPNKNIESVENGELEEGFIKSADAGLTQEELDDKYLAPHYRRQEIGSAALDFVPVLGSAKMVHESFTGQQEFTGHKIEGWRRLVHGVSGAAFLASDLSGVGAVASLGGKALLRGGIKFGEKIASKSLTSKAVSEGLEKSSEKIIENKAAILASNASSRRKRSDKIEKANALN